MQRIESEEFAPREFVPLATIPAGHQALMYLLTFSTSTRPWTHCTSAGCATHATENNYGPHASNPLLLIYACYSDRLLVLYASILTDYL